jgi:hypothetical protein
MKVTLSCWDTASEKIKYKEETEVQKRPLNISQVKVEGKEAGLFAQHQLRGSGRQ